MTDAPVTWADGVVKGAVLSDDGLYRYCLSRDWDWERATMIWIMLNPSTADAEVDDPTIRRCMSFARREGCGGIIVLNLYGLRATKPKHLLDHPDPNGAGNADMWAKVLAANPFSTVVAAWGAFDHSALPRSIALRNQRMGRGHWKCLGRTKGGHPRHPLYVRGDAGLVDL